MLRRTSTRAGLGTLLLATCAWLAGATPAAASPYDQTNLISDGSVPAAHLDSNLVNPWGIAYSATGPFWISDNNSGLATIYNTSNGSIRSTISVAPPPGSLAGTTATPTGQVFNSGGSTDFMVTNGTTSAKSSFLFATEDGTISGWASSVNPNSSVIAVDNSGSGAVYKGLAIGSSGGASMLYAANFNSGMVEVYNGAFHQVNSFTDTSLPAGYAPFNVQTLNGHLFVTFALQDADKHDDVSGAGNGFVDEFDMSGTLIRRVASNGALNSPWGLALAPAQFGQFANDLLVGNFGDGHISAYNPTSGAFMGQLTGIGNMPISIGDLWALIVGNGGSGGDTGTVYFTAGVENEAHGLFGALNPVPEPRQVALFALGLLAIAWTRRQRLQSR